MIYSVYWAAGASHKVAPKLAYSTIRPAFRTYLADLTAEEFEKCQGAPWFGTPGKTVALCDAIKASVDDTYVFILAREQKGQFEQWVRDEKLEEYVMFKMPRPITNRNHYTTERRELTLAVLQSLNHYQRKDVV